jgi:hypothetical protein
MKVKLIAFFIGQLFIFMPVYGGKSVNRGPAHINPESTLTVPLEIKRSVYKEIVKNNMRYFGRMKDHVRAWEHQDKTAKRLRLDNTGIYQPIATEEKVEIVKSELLYFFKKRAREPLQQRLRDIRLTNTESEEEVDYRKELLEMDKRKGKVFVYEISNNKRVKKEVATTSQPEKKAPAIKSFDLLKDLKLTLKPRVFKGLLIAQVRSPYFRLDSTIGVNGSVEMTFSQHIRSIDTSVFMNYSLEKERVIANVEKRLNPQWTLRYINEFDPAKEVSFDKKSQLSLHFNMPF